MISFKREIRVEFGGVDVAPITDLRVIFDVSKENGTQSNKGVISIFNMKPSSRQAVLIAKPKRDINDPPHIKVRLFAGYEGELKQLISGNILISKSTKRGADWVTDIEIWSGLSNAVQATVIIDREGKTSAKNIADEIIKPLGLSVTYTKKALDILKDKTYFGFSESGMSIIAIKRFLKRFDLIFTIDDEAAVIGRRGEAENPEEAKSIDNTFNLENGLIGSPTITRVGADFLALLRPEINVLKKIFLQSRTINETLSLDQNAVSEYVVKTIRHFGDTRDDAWFTEISSTYSDIVQ